MAKEVKKTTDNTSSPVWRNMVISVLTTILISATVYFLGFNKPSGASKIEVGKATVEAWKAYVTSENIDYRNIISLMIDAGQFDRYKDMFQEILTESLKLQSAIEQLIKKEDIDKDMVTLLTRRLENERNAIPMSEEEFAGMDRLLDTALNMDWTEEQFNQKLAARMNKFAVENKRLFDRLTTDIEELSKTLARRYDVAFDMNDFYFIQLDRKKRDIYAILNDEAVDSSAADATREYFLGKWRIKNENTFVVFKADGNYRWEMPNIPESKIAKGSWQIINRQLILGFTPWPDSINKTPKPGKWTFDISNVTPNSACMQVVIDPYNFYVLVRQ